MPSSGAPSATITSSCASGSWIALPIALLGRAPGYGYWKARVPKLYAAAATLQFEKQTTVVLSTSVVDSSIRNDFDINTYVQDMQSNKVRELVIASLTPEEKKVLLRPYLKNLPPGQPAPAGGRRPRLGLLRSRAQAAS